jgi:hypothetical protein
MVTNNLLNQRRINLEERFEGAEVLFVQPGIGAFGGFEYLGT